jgi:hypothetical protein
MKNYYKKDAIVIYHYKEWHRVYYNALGYDWVSVWKRAVMLENPRDEYGRFTNDFSDEYAVNFKLKDEDGKVFTATLDEIEPDVAPGALSHEELIRLYNEIVRGSLYYSDYQNTMGVFQETAYDFYEGFWEQLKDEYGSEAEAEKHDTAEAFADYCEGCEYYRPSSLAA